MQTLYDTLLIFRYQMRLSLRNPIWVVIGLTQPILYLALFGPLLSGIAGNLGPPGVDPWQIYVPGLLVQLSMFGSGFVGFAIIAELRMGVIERMRVTPVSRMALLLGRVLRDVVVLLVQSALLILVAYPFGLRAPILGVLLGLCFVPFLALSLASLSYAAGLLTKDEDAFAPLVSMVSVPLMLLSGILLPMTLAPPWLSVLAHANPFLYVVDAIRSVFLGEYATATVFIGAVVAVLLAVASVAFGTRVFRRQNV
jgi:ABC-2 type transport system permease protein